MSLATKLLGSSSAVEANYIEDVFSTYLYTGNGSTQTINNGIDLAGEGGLVWLKLRNFSSTYSNSFVDTARGRSKTLNSNLTAAETTSSAGTDFSSFNSNGFTLGTGLNQSMNDDGGKYASWTFRKQPKFFDVVTWTGDGSALKTITHSLGSVPGCIIVKSTSSASWNWTVYHQALGITQKIYLNTTGAAIAENGNFGGTAPTSTEFSVGYASTNESGGTYVAYLFAHNAGGFGESGTDNVISCGSFTADGSGKYTVNIGWEPQWILTKFDADDNWRIFDSMRGWTASNTQADLQPNTSSSELANNGYCSPTATGFRDNGSIGAGQKVIYIAIRRGPMKTPTDGTKVFAPVTGVGVSSITTNFPVDMTITGYTAQTTDKWIFDRLRGSTDTAGRASAVLITNITNAETSQSGYGLGYDDNTGFSQNWYGGTSPTVFWNFRRAPSFFDEVCYTGTGYTEVQNLPHNLTAVPEMMIVKGRSYSGDSWIVYHSAIGNTKYLQLNATSNSSTATLWNDTTPTASVFTVGNNTATNMSGATYVTYLFATCPGVSKVGSYTGNGTTQTIPCGFAAGARFVLIKRTDSTGDWYVWDSARGIVAGNDPHLSLNSTAAEVTSNDSVDPASTGFIVNQVAATNVNVSGGSYIFLAIA